MGQNLIVTKPSAGLALLTINGKGSQNFVNSDLAVELDEICREINMDNSIHAVILSGPAGRAFCTVIEGAETSMGPLAAPIAQLTCPVIAALYGHVTGQALEIALACDIRLATPGTRFSWPGILKGMMPSDGATQRLPRLIGKAKAMEMLLTGEIISARQALRIGLINRLVGKDVLLTEAEELGRGMAEKAVLSLKYCKEAVLKGMDMTLDQGLRLEGDLYYLLQTTQDRSEGILAFREKRKAVFKGI